MRYDINKFIEIDRSLSQTKTAHNKQNVPDSKTFADILEMAEKGNEMAALHIMEWSKDCKPESHIDKQLFQNINNAKRKLFFNKE